MRNSTMRVVHVWPMAVALVLFACTNTPGNAHVIWSQTNSVDADTLFLTHMDDTTKQEVPAEASLASDLGLTPTSALVQITTGTDVPSAIFGPHSLQLTQSQTLRSTATVSDLTGDLTIEFWFKWLPTMTSSTLQVGLASGAKIMIARDALNSANDRFGVAGTHGSYRSTNGFVDWPNVGEEEAGLNTWRHLGLTIHSAGIAFDPAAEHDVYLPGTVGRMYLFGHAAALPPTDIEIDLAGLKVHDASAIQLQMTGSGIAVDEITIWKKDWSENGSNHHPFSDGRGNAGIENALSY